MKIVGLWRYVADIASIFNAETQRREDAESLREGAVSS